MNRIAVPVRIPTRERVCLDHATCERNQRTAFRTAQTCLSCERHVAVHFMAGESGTSAYLLRCNECLVSMFGCPHAAPHTCGDCFDAVTLDIHDGSDDPSSWEATARILLADTPKNLRIAVREGGGLEDVKASLTTTFVKLRDLAMQASGGKA